MTEAELDAIFAALAHPARRRIIDLVVQTPGLRVVDLSEAFDTSRIAVMKHLRALEDASLLTSRKEGRERRYFFNAVPLVQIADRWTDEYSSFFAARAVDIAERLESRASPSKREHADPQPSSAGQGKAADRNGKGKKSA